MDRRTMVLKVVCLAVVLTCQVFVGTIHGAGNTVSILGSWVKGTTHAKEAGADRALVVMVYGEGSAAISASRVTYGDQVMTPVTEKSFSNGIYSYTGAFILDEAKIAAASSGAIAVTWRRAPSAGSAVVSAFLTNVNQASPVGAAMTAGIVGRTITAPSAPAHNAGDMILVAGTAANNGTYTINNGFTRGIPETSAGFGDITSAYTTGSGLPAIPSLSQSTRQRQTMVALVVKVDPSPNLPPTVSFYSPVHGVVFKAPATIQVNIDANDPDGSISRVELRNNGVLAGPSQSPYSHQFKLSNLGAGSYTLEARAFDNRNTASTSTITIIVRENVPWQETFNLPNGAVSDGSPTSWKARRTSGMFAVNGNRLTVNGAGSEAVLTTGVMNIASSNVEVSLDISSRGKLESYQDYVKVYKKVNGGAEVLIGEKWGNQAATSLSQKDISGTTLQLVIRAFVSAGDEYYFLDNLSVTPCGFAWRQVGAPIAKSVSSMAEIFAANGITYTAVADPLADGRLTVTMFNGTAWEPVGERGISTSEVTSFKMCQENGELFVAYTENDRKGYVKKFNGSSWQAVGSSRFTDSGGNVYDFEVYNGNPVVSFSLYTAAFDGDCYYGVKTAIALWNGSAWNRISEYCTWKYGSQTQISFVNGVLYAESHYFDQGSSWISLSKWNGSDWEEVTSKTFGPQAYGIVVLEGNKVYYLGNEGDISGCQMFDGQRWSYIGPTNFLPDKRDYTAMTVSNGKPYIAFQRYETPFQKPEFVSVMTFNGQGWVYVGNENFLDGGFGANGQIAVNGTTPYLLLDSDWDNAEISVMRYSDGVKGWQTLTLPSIVNTSTEIFALNGNIYLAGADQENLFRLSVHKFNGTSWEPLGARGFSTRYIPGSVKLAQERGELFVAYIEGDYKGYVRKFNGVSWEPAGTGSFTDNGISVFDLEIINGSPHVTYVVKTDVNDPECYWANLAEVVRWNGASWSTIERRCSGSRGSERQLSSVNGVLYGLIYEQDMDQYSWIGLDAWTGNAWTRVTSKNLNPHARFVWDVVLEGDKIYVAYIDNITNAINCEKFDGQNWSGVGPRDFYTGSSLGGVHLAVSNGKPWIAFEDAGLASVMTFNGQNWVDVGNKIAASRLIYKVIANGLSPHVLFDPGHPEVTIMKYE